MNFKRFIHIHILLITCLLIIHINIAQESTDYDDSSDEIDIEIEIYDEEPHEVLAQQIFNSYIFPAQIIDKSYS